ncbi:serine/threonine protein kinase [Dictyobacter kobayashii]|uniref:non-specific serine/threonine protein kinase n=1 Tax=Dictyobacter kobayashii TaxID=2014872 RepID=A0A402ANV1_9CHLR|nr:serine/threonine-protein kinase [Dictyobacter kobayashii]GCE20650.1 hypothetical protein KDK_44500 [Dictyobacter kobayashii]
MQDLLNTVISHYTIVRHIARGGMSDIYLARDLTSNREVALKLVHSGNHDYCLRFQREAQAITTLRHKHILPALDYGEVDPWCYLVTPYVPNGTLRDLVQAGPLTLEDTGKYLDQVASALHYAHEQGIVHRDIKSSNILMRDRDFVYLADFGLVKNTRSVAESLTESGFLVGTAEYMAPELAERDATHLSDIYALGIVLYQMLTGDVPFKGSTPVGTFMQHLSKKVSRPSLVNPGIPAAFDKVVLRALAKEPARRYQSALELAAAYQQALDVYSRQSVNEAKTTQHLPVLPAAPPVVVVSPLRRQPPRRVALPVVLASVALLTLGLSSFALPGGNIRPVSATADSLIQAHATIGASTPIVVKTTPPANNKQSNTPGKTTPPANNRRSGTPGKTTPSTHNSRSNTPVKSTHTVNATSSDNTPAPAAKAAPPKGKPHAKAAPPKGKPHAKAAPPKGKPHAGPKK